MVDPRVRVNVNPRGKEGRVRVVLGVGVVGLG